MMDKSPKRARVRITSLLAEMRPFGLLEADVHAVEKSATDEGNLIHDQKLNTGPLLLKSSRFNAGKLFLEGAFRKHAKTGTCRLGSKTNIECGKLLYRP